MCSESICEYLNQQVSSIISVVTSARRKGSRAMGSGASAEGLLAEEGLVGKVMR